MLTLGILLVLLTLAVAIAIGAKANQSVRSFDEERHEMFLGADREIRAEMKKPDVPNAQIKA